MAGLVDVFWAYSLEKRGDCLFGYCLFHVLFAQSAADADPALVLPPHCRKPYPHNIYTYNMYNTNKERE